MRRADQEAHRPAALLPLARQERGGLGVGPERGAPRRQGHRVGLVLQAALHGHGRLPQAPPPEHPAAERGQRHHAVDLGYDGEERRGEERGDTNRQTDM